MHQRAAKMHMGRITFTAQEQHEDIISAVEDEADVDSRAEAVRQCISRYENLQQSEEDLKQEVEQLQQTVERLQNEKRLILENREEKKELARYVEDKRSREERWDEASMTTRLKWKVFGMPSKSADS